MPELPEVESTRRQLAPHLEGAIIRSVSLGSPRVSRRNVRPDDIVDRLTNRRVDHVGRRGKFLTIEVADDLTWIIHLGMSGRISVVESDDSVALHTHMRVLTDRGAEIRLIDTRTFGFVAVLTPDELAADPISRLGRDAWLDLPSPSELGAALENRIAPIKALLLDQGLIAGLGNIYADEILFRAGLHPERRGGSLNQDEIERLHGSVRPVLETAITSNGTSLDDLAYLLPDGRAGEMLDQLAVYGSDGTPCPRCGSEIRRIVVRGRSAHFCPSCQPRGGGGR